MRYLFAIPTPRHRRQIEKLHHAGPRVLAGSLDDLRDRMKGGEEVDDALAGLLQQCAESNPALWHSAGAHPWPVSIRLVSTSMRRRMGA
jgi:hypothetical protein